MEGDQAPALGLRAGPKSSDRFWPLGSVRAARVLSDHERDQERGDQRRDDQPVSARGERHGGNQRNDCHYSLQALSLAEPGGDGHQASEEKSRSAECDERSRVV